MWRASILPVTVVAALSLIAVSEFAAKKCGSIQAHCVLQADGKCDPTAARPATMAKIIRHFFSGVPFRAS